MLMTTHLIKIKVYLKTITKSILTHQILIITTIKEHSCTALTAAIRKVKKAETAVSSQCPRTLFTVLS